MPRLLTAFTTMRSYLPDFELHAAASLDEALTIMAAEPGAWRPFAGGTDLMVLLEAGKLAAGRYVEPAALRRAPRHLDRRSGDRHRRADDVHGRDALSGAAAPSIRCCAAAAAETGGVATQNRGTIGGNIANASPAADTPPALLVYDAELELVSVARHAPRSLRPLSLGYKQMDLAPDELIHSVRVVRGRGSWRAGIPQGRHAPGAGDLEGVRRRGASILPAASSPTPGSRSAASRRQWSAPRTRKRRCADGR